MTQRVQLPDPLVVIDGAVDPDRGNFSFAPGEPVTLSFDVPQGAGVIEPWLPSNSLVEARAVVIDDGATLSAPPL